MKFPTWIAAAASLALLVGCSSSRNPGADEPPVAAALRDLNDLLRTTAGGHSPTKLSDLDRHKSMFSRAYEAVKSGEVVVLWGAAQKGEGETGKNEAVVAYEKDAPTNGGYVLLSAGSVKKMTASEFAAAPKAGKH